MIITHRHVHDVSKQSGVLLGLLTSFLEAYNRRTDVMERAVELDERVKSITHKLDVAGENLREAVNKNQP